MPRLALSFLLLLACALAPDAAVAQVRQCVGADGVLVYSDRKCEDIGARERPALPAAEGIGDLRPARGGCSRSVQDLAHALGSALQAGDANQVAGVYDWAGMSTANGYRVMERLEAIARRPLVDLQPVYAGGDEYGFDAVEFNADGEVVGTPPRKPRLVGLRVEQTLADGSTPARTVFGLRRHLGCWWIRL